MGAGGSAWADATVAADTAAPEARPAKLVRLRLPLTGAADATYQSLLQRAVDQLAAVPAGAEGARPLLVIEFVPAEEGASTEFERALRLARFLVSDEMARVKTLAYLPDTLEGHAVLIALACEEIAIAPDAQFGAAGADEDASRPIEPGIRASYQQIAESRRSAPSAVVLAMIDRGAELTRVETEAGVEYALAGEVDALRAERTLLEEQVLAPAGSLALFTGREAREEGFAKYLVADRESLARALSVPADALLEDQSLVDEWRPVMIDLEGPITHKAVRRIETLLGDELERNDVNWVGVRIDSSGGDPAAAVRLAQTLAELGDGEVRSVAYVPRRAEGPAALVALACDQLVMQKGSELVGAEGEDKPPAAAPPEGDEVDEGDEAAADEEAAEPDEPDRRLRWFDQPQQDEGDPQQDAVITTVRESLAPATARSWSLLSATLDPSVELHRYSDRETGAERVFSPEELEEQEEPARWRQGERVKRAGESLRFDAAEAVDAGVAWQTVEQFDGLQALYGFTEPPRTATPNWASELVEALASPGLAALLLIVGLMGLYLELNTPGLGFGGFLGTVALLLFFWSKFLDGTADWLEVLLFVTGVVFVLMEVFVLPGVGVFGLGGALLVIGSLVLASQTFVLPKTESQLIELRNSLATVVGAGFGCLLLAAALRSYLPQSTLFRRATLAPLEEADRIEQDRRESLADYAHLMGHRGVATTDLLPAGRAEIDGEPVDVITDGDVIDRGTEIEVVETHANRVVVRRVRA